MTQRQISSLVFQGGQTRAQIKRKLAKILGVDKSRILLDTYSKQRDGSYEGTYRIVRDPQPKSYHVTF